MLFEEHKGKIISTFSIIDKLEEAGIVLNFVDGTKAELTFKGNKSIGILNQEHNYLASIEGSTFKYMYVAVMNNKARPMGDYVKSVIAYKIVAADHVGLEVYGVFQVTLKVPMNFKINFDFPPPPKDKTR